MTKNEFVKKYNQAAEVASFHHYIKLNEQKPEVKLTTLGKSPKEVQYIAVGDNVSFIIAVNSEKQVTSVTMVDAKADRQDGYQVIVIALLIDVLIGVEQRTRNAILSKLGLYNGTFLKGKKVQITNMVSAKIWNEPSSKVLYFQILLIE